MFLLLQISEHFGVFIIDYTSVSDFGDESCQHGYESGLKKKNGWIELIDKQEAFRERRHFHVWELWPWVVSQGQENLCY